MLPHDSSELVFLARDSYHRATGRDPAAHGGAKDLAKALREAVETTGELGDLADRLVRGGNENADILAVIDELASNLMVLFHEAADAIEADPEKFSFTCATCQRRPSAPGSVFCAGYDCP